MIVPSLMRRRSSGRVRAPAVYGGDVDAIARTQRSRRSRRDASPSFERMYAVDRRDTAAAAGHPTPAHGGDSTSSRGQDGAI